MAALKPYRGRRDFNRTREPVGSGAGGGGFSFVVQKHAARRLHYDFRLELDGVLLSWAVPKGPNLDPKVRRLAIQTEDHPLEYAGFEGTIPRGQYGAGTVVVWDRGTWTPLGDPRAAYRKGHLSFVLNGQKLRGAWHLVRQANAEDQKSWLLLKAKDSEARADGDVLLTNKPESALSGLSLEQLAAESGPLAPPSGQNKHPPHPEPTDHGQAAILTKTELDDAPRRPLPVKFSVELATLVKSVPEGPEWLHETKFDGYRLIARVEQQQVRLFTRRVQDWTARFPGLARAFASLPAQSAVLDGEVVVERSDGVSDFQQLQNLLEGSVSGQLLYRVFDLLYLNGHDLRTLELERRKWLLSRLLDGMPTKSPIRYTDHVLGQGQELYQRACQVGLEGIVSKRRRSAYRSGRGRDWVKVKCTSSQEFVIGGFTKPGGSRHYLGALLLGVREGEKLRYCGKVGTGFTEPSLRELHARLSSVVQPEPPFFNPPRGADARGVNWVNPSYLCQVQFSEFTSDGMLRHPSFRGLREDKAARQAERERTEARVETSRAALSNPNRVLYPEEGITKSALLDYYQMVADWMLPHVADRPLTLLRCPEGHDKGCFFQKHALRGLPASILKVRLAEKGQPATYLAIDDIDGLLGLVQLGVLEIHTWGSRASDPEHPDLLVFDLDPDPEVPWTRVIGAARLVRDLFEHLGLQTFLKTTGGKGLHVCLPVEPRLGWQETEAFCRGVAETIARFSPNEYVATQSKAKRRGKIFIDFMRNGRGATFIAPYSTRARPGAPIAVPLGWEELSPKLRGDTFRIGNVGQVLDKHRGDPWKRLPGLRQSITDNMQQAVNAARLRQPRR